MYWLNWLCTCFEIGWVCVWTLAYNFLFAKFRFGINCANWVRRKASTCGRVEAKRELVVEPKQHSNCENLRKEAKLGVLNVL